MAFRGTGGSTDPLIPGSAPGNATITDLLEVLDYVQTQSIAASVLLDSDIDCYDDPNYVGYTSVLKFSAANGNHPGVVSFTSDNGNRTIRGLTVKDQYFMTLFGYDGQTYTTIDGINFIDCFFKPTSSQTCYIFGGATDSNALLRNSTISMTVYSNTSTSNPSVPNVCYKTCNFVNCSMYFKYNTNARTGYNDRFLVTANSYFKNTQSCVFVFDGLHINCNTTWDYPLVSLQNNSGSDSSYNSFIFKNCVIKGSTNGSYGIYVLRYGSYNYAAFVNPTLEDPNVTSRLGGFNGTSHCLCASDKFGTVFNPISVSSDLGEYCTLTQLKDVDYLLDVGFVP